MTEHKFEVGQLVWSPKTGWGIIEMPDGEDTNYDYPIRVIGERGGSDRYTSEGRLFSSDLHPMLFTPAQAKALGHKPPPEKRIIKGFFNVYENHVDFYATLVDANHCANMETRLACVPCTSDEFEIQL